MDIYLPDDDTSVLGKPVQPRSKDWVQSECLELPIHYSELRWAFSPELARQLGTRKSQFTQLCAPEWTEERVASMRQGLCLQFLRDPLLRRVAQLRLTSVGSLHDDAADGGVDLERELASCLDELWIEQREAFLEDV